MEHHAWIYLIDDDNHTHRRVRHLAAELDAGCQVYLTAEQFLSQQSLPRPACLVAELNLLGMSGLELQQRLQAGQVHIPIVFLSCRPEVTAVVRAIRGGADDVLDKSTEDSTLRQAISSALATELRTARIDRAHRELHHRLNELTAKERDVLDFVVQGKPNKVIAKRLGVSVRTVEVRRQHIFRKTQTRSVAQLVRLVLQVRGHVTDDDDMHPNSVSHESAGVVSLATPISRPR